MEQMIWVYAFGGLIVIAIWAWVLVEIIRFATRETRYNSEIQVKLLIELLKKHNVPKEKYR